MTLRIPSSRSRLGWSAIVGLPFAILWLTLAGLVRDPVWMGSDFHFLIVSLTSFIAMLMAVFMIVAASQLRDARVVFLSLAFLGIAGIFSVHALTTPGALVPGVNPWIGFSARLSLLVGSIFFALSTVEWPPAVERKIIAWQRQLTGIFAVGMLAFAFLALASSLSGTHDSSAQASAAPVAAQTSTSDARDGGNDYGYGSPSTATQNAGPPVGDGLGRFGFLMDDALSTALTFSSLALLGMVVVRYARMKRIAGSPLISGFLVSSIFLFQGQVSMSWAPLWHASWWLYHVLLFSAFAAALSGMIVEYSISGSLRGVVEGLLLRDTIAQLQRGYTEVIVALVGAVEAKDVYTRGHTQRVSDLAVRIGHELRLPREQLKVLAQAALLHDIGKIGVPDSILNKPDLLTPEEFAIIKEHPARGHAIIKDVRSLQAEIGGVRHHHERLDGSGYPDGLVGDAIPLEARIIAVADVFDALTSLRPYRAAWSQERALALLSEQAGRQLDARCVQALQRILTERSASVPVPVPLLAAAD